jgi:hypothetical protein
MSPFVNHKYKILIDTYPVKIKEKILKIRVYSQVFDETTCECVRLIFHFLSQFLMDMAEILSADRVTQGLSVV